MTQNDPSLDLDAIELRVQSSVGGPYWLDIEAGTEEPTRIEYMEGGEEMRLLCTVMQPLSACTDPALKQRVIDTLYMFVHARDDIEKLLHEVRWCHTQMAELQRQVDYLHKQRDGAA